MFRGGRVQLEAIKGKLAWEVVIEVSVKGMVGWSYHPPRGN